MGSFMNRENIMTLIMKNSACEQRKLVLKIYMIDEEIISSLYSIIQYLVSIPFHAFEKYFQAFYFLKTLLDDNWT